MERLMTMRQVAETLGCSVYCVRTLIRRGKLNFTRFSPDGAYRIFSSSVEELVSDGAKSPDGVDHERLGREAMERVERRLRMRPYQRKSQRTQES